MFFFRYSAVCDPFSYKESSKPENVNMRVFKYSLIVIIFSLIINFPRFFETQIVEESLISNNSGQAEVISFITYDVTQLRRDPDYIRYVIRIRYCST